MMKSTNRDIGISISRLFAICLILMCHVFQAVDNPICYFLNIGVQMFLFMSGYLYGTKSIQDVYEWYKKRAHRILIPYYIMLFIIVLVNCIQRVPPTPLELVSSLLCMQWYGYSVPNAGHLWYISCILFCYLITPIIQAVTEKIMGKKFREYISLLFGLALILQVLETLNCITQIASMIFAYILGYVFSKNRMLEKISSSVVYYGGGVCL